MKEKFKTILIIFLLIISTGLIIFIYKTNRFSFILPGYSIRSMSITDYRDRNEPNGFTDHFREADSIFYEKYEFPLTR